MAFERRTYRSTGAGGVNVQAPDQTVLSNRTSLVAQGLRGIGGQTLDLLADDDYDAKNKRLGQALTEENQRSLMNLTPEELASDEVVQRTLFENREKFMGKGNRLGRWGHTKKNRERAQEDFLRYKKGIIALRQENLQERLGEDTQGLTDLVAQADILREAAADDTPDEEGKEKQLPDKVADTITKRVEDALPPEVIGQPDVQEEDVEEPEEAAEEKWREIEKDTETEEATGVRDDVQVLESTDGKFRKAQYFTDESSPFSGVVYPHNELHEKALAPIVKGFLLGGELNADVVKVFKGMTKDYTEDEFRAMLNATYFDEQTDDQLNPLMDELKKQGVSFRPATEAMEKVDMLTALSKRISPAELAALKKDHGRRWKEVLMTSALNVLANDASFRGDQDQQRAVMNMTSYLVNTGKIRRSAGEQVLANLSKKVQQEFQQAEIRDKRERQQETLMLEESYMEMNKALVDLVTAEESGDPLQIEVAKDRVNTAKRKYISLNPKYASSYSKLLNLHQTFLRKPGNMKQFKYFQGIAQQYFEGKISAQQHLQSVLRIAGDVNLADPNFALNFHEAVVKAGGERTTGKTIQKFTELVSKNDILGTSNQDYRLIMAEGANRVLPEVLSLYIAKEKKAGRDVNIADAHKVVRERYLERMALYGVFSRFFPGVPKDDVAAEILSGPGDRPSLLTFRPLKHAFDALENKKAMHHYFGRPLTEREIDAVQQAVTKLKVDYGESNLTDRLDEAGRSKKDWKQLVKEGNSILGTNQQGGQ